MPHIIVEYSANLETKIEIPGLISHLHAAALGTGVFPHGGTRTRAERRDIYEIADGDPDNGFVHIMARIGTGRDEETRVRASEELFGAASAFLDELFETTPLGLSLEIVEIAPETSHKRNNIHEHLKRKQSA